MSYLIELFSFLVGSAGFLFLVVWGVAIYMKLGERNLPDYYKTLPLGDPLCLKATLRFIREQLNEGWVNLKRAGGTWGVLGGVLAVITVLVVWWVFLTLITSPLAGFVFFVVILTISVIGSISSGIIRWIKRK